MRLVETEVQVDGKFYRAVGEFTEDGAGEMTLWDYWLESLEDHTVMSVPEKDASNVEEALWDGFYES